MIFKPVQNLFKQIEVLQKAVASKEMKEFLHGEGSQNKTLIKILVLFTSKIEAAKETVKENEVKKERKKLSEEDKAIVQKNKTAFALKIQQAFSRFLTKLVAKASKKEKQKVKETEKNIKKGIENPDEIIKESGESLDKLEEAFNSCKVEMPDSLKTQMDAFLSGMKKSMEKDWF